MPTIPLAFLRPLYDIAVWQYLLMCGFTQGEKNPTMTLRMHEVVANFMCKLLDAKAFSHLKEKLEEEEVSTRTGNWQPGQRATQRIVDWCQDQWRRKKPVLPKSMTFEELSQPMCMPLFSTEMPVCHVCGCPCPECRSDLDCEIPEELLAARRIRDYNEEEEEEEDQQDENNDEEEEEPEERMQLRKRKRDC